MPNQAEDMKPDIIILCSKKRREEMGMKPDKTKLSNPFPAAFFQPLLPGFLHSFSIPKSFVKKLEERDFESVVLMREQDHHKEPPRHWLVKVEGERRFKEGWPDFAKHHDLRVGDFVVFRHQGHLLFHVSVFDPITACDRPSHHHNPHATACVKDKTQPKHNARKRQTLSCLVTLSKYSVKTSIVNLPRYFVRSSGLANRRCQLMMVDGKKRSWEVQLSYKKCDGQSYIGQGWRQFQSTNGFKPGQVVRFWLLKGGESPVMKCCRARSSSNAQIHEG